MINLKKHVGTISLSLVAVAIAGFGVYCAFQLTTEESQKKMSAIDNRDVAEVFYSDEDYEDHKNSGILETPPQEDLLSRYESMKAINNDYVCWLSIPDTRVDYAVAQEGADNIGYYLHTNFKKKQSSYGCPYLSAACTIDGGNLVIQAHNMRDGSMFGSLKNYKDAGWARNHRTIEIYTDTEHRYYEVIAVFTQAFDRPVVNWNNYTTLSNAEQSFNYATECVNHSIVDFGYEPVLNNDVIEQYVTLSTCEYTHSNGRLLVVARLLPSA